MADHEKSVFSAPRTSLAEDGASDLQDTVVPVVLFSVIPAKMNAKGKHPYEDFSFKDSKHKC